MSNNLRAVGGHTLWT